jgi:hypothetical protein
MKQSTTEITLTQSQMGAACGITQSQASRDLRAAGIEPTASGYSLEHLARLAEWRALERVGAASDGTVYDTDRERGRLLAHQADLAKLKIDEERADLVRMTVVEKYWAEMGAACRGKLLALPSRIGAVIPDPVARVKLTTTAERLVYEALAEIQSDAVPHDVRERANRATKETRA